MRALYRLYFILAYPFVRLLCPCRIKGREKIPEGPLIICANHSSNADPLLIALCSGIKHHLFFMAKAELFENKISGGILSAIGVFPVQRDSTDIKSIRTMMQHLKDGDKVMIFPEGTRVSEDESVAAKTGAVRIAGKMNIPILPVYLTSGKKLFRFSVINVGESYVPEKPKDKNYDIMAQDLMDRIYALEPSK